MPYLPLWNVEFLTRLTTANAVFQARIRQEIPNNVVVKDRAHGVKEIHPGDFNYEAVLKRFESEVSSADSIAILDFLYQFEMCLKEDFSRFQQQYQDLYQNEEWRWTEIRGNYPRLYQTTISYILSGKHSDTIVSYRLEDLERIGLVERSEVPAPKSKSVTITATGIFVVEAAIEEAQASLRPLFERPAGRAKPASPWKPSHENSGLNQAPEPGDPEPLEQPVAPQK